MAKKKAAAKKGLPAKKKSVPTLIEEEVPPAEALRAKPICPPQSAFSGFSFSFTPPLSLSATGPAAESVVFPPSVAPSDHVMSLQPVEVQIPERTLHSRVPSRTSSSGISPGSPPPDEQHLVRNWSPPPQSENAPRSSSDSVDANATLAEYVQRRRELLEVLKDLHSTGIQNELDLPQIVVVGSQSVGKSSLIESMSGITLPRDSGTCTRCPMECRLQYSPTWSCTIVLRFQADSNGRPLANVREVVFGTTMYDKHDVEKMLRRAQRAILRPTLDANVFLDDGDLVVNGHPAHTFSANCVCIRVAGPNAPDLYFYDLPGIIANVGDGENIADTALVENLAKSYMRRPHCIVLLVISCETDFENQGAGRLILGDMHLRRRTVGVLTKVDRIEPGAASKWLKILRNEENILHNGWFCVKQPDIVQLQSGIAWEDAGASERAFFASNAPWAELERSHRMRLGSEGLSDRLATILSNLVSQELPSIQDKILHHLHRVNMELIDLAPPNLKDPRHEIIILLRDFNKKLSRHIEGLPPNLSPSGSFDIVPCGLIHSLHQAFDRFRVKVNQTAPQFRPWSSRQTIFDGLEQQMLASISQDDDAATMGRANTMHLDQVMDLAKRSRTRELPGNYPFSVKENLIAESVRHWGPLAQKCFKEVTEIVATHVNRLIEDHFGRYSHGGLMHTVQRVAQTQIQERARSAADRIESLCRNEASPYTQNEHYFVDYRSKLLRQYKMVHKQAKGHSAVVLALQQHGSRSPSTSTSQHINSALSSLASIGINGLGPEDLAKLLPDDEMSPALEIMAEVRAYFQVAYKRFTDNIPKQIDTDFVRDIDVNLDIALRSLDMSAEQCTEWLQEHTTTVQQREELAGKKKRLELAKEKLANYYRGQGLAPFEPSVPMVMHSREREWTDL